MQFGVNKHGLIFKDNKFAQARNLREKSIRERQDISKMRARAICKLPSLYALKKALILVEEKKPATMQILLMLQPK